MKLTHHSIDGWMGGWLLHDDATHILRKLAGHGRAGGRRASRTATCMTLTRASGRRSATRPSTWPTTRSAPTRIGTGRDGTVRSGSDRIVLYRNQGRVALSLPPLRLLCWLRHAERHCKWTECDFVHSAFRFFIRSAVFHTFALLLMFATSLYFQLPRAQNNETIAECFCTVATTAVSLASICTN